MDLIARVVAAGRDPKSMKVEDVDTSSMPPKPWTRPVNIQQGPGVPQ